jgi:hypothetical protein
MLKKESFHAGRTWWFGRISNLRTSQRLCKLSIYIYIYIACDARAFCTMVTIQCGEPEQTDSQFHYHAHRRIHSITMHTEGSIPFVSHEKQTIRFSF